MAQNGTVGDDLTLALALASGASVPDAARQAGMAVRTVYRWLARPEFRHRVARIQQSITRRAVGRISDGMSEAADALRELLKCEDHAVRLRAARALFEVGTRLRDTVELEARLVDLEQERLKEGAPTP